MELFTELGTFVDNTGKVIEYIRYYVIIMNVKVYLKPSDSTGANLLKAYLEANK